MTWSIVTTMNIKRWSEVDISAPEVVLFIYLMFRKDYGYHIADKFKDATEKEKWDNAWGVGSLKHSNKVDSLLVAMAAKNLLIELHPTWGKQRKNSVEADMANNPRRKYYCVNPNVLAMSRSITLTKEEIKEVKGEIRETSLDPDDMPEEAYVQYYKQAFDRESLVDGKYPYTKDVSLFLRLLELFAPKESMCIQWINGLKIYDYHTILTIARTLLTAVIRYCESQMQDLDLNTEDCMVDFLSYSNFDEKIKQVEKEYGVEITPEDLGNSFLPLCSYLDRTLSQLPYIERGLKSVFNVIYKDF